MITLLHNASTGRYRDYSFDNAALLNNVGMLYPKIKTYWKQEKNQKRVALFLIASMTSG